MRSAILIALTLVFYSLPAAAQTLSQDMTNLKAELRTYIHAGSTSRQDAKIDRFTHLLQVPWQETMIREWVFRFHRASPAMVLERREFDHKGTATGSQGIQVRSVKLTYKNRSYTMHYYDKDHGTKPKQGWPLVIAMHGGGAMTQDFNDRQWRNMWARYYPFEPRNSTKPYYNLTGPLNIRYVALRAPDNDHTGFRADYFYALLKKFIKHQIYFAGVDPDRIYLMGYSHGGYGAFAAGPVLFDRFAGIQATAGGRTPSETRPRNLRNVFFSHMIGSLDTEYDRLKANRTFHQKVVQLRSQYGQGSYPGEFKVIAGAKHSETPDENTLALLFRQTRNAVPSQINWYLTDTDTRQAHWLRVKGNNRRMILEARIANNRVDIQEANIDRIFLRLDKRLIDLNRGLTVSVNSGNAKSFLLGHWRKISNLVRTLEETGDPKLMFDIVLDVDAPGESTAMKNELKRSDKDYLPEALIVIGYTHDKYPNHFIDARRIERGPQRKEYRMWRSVDLNFSGRVLSRDYEEALPPSHSDYLDLKLIPHLRTNNHTPKEVVLRLPAFDHQGKSQLSENGRVLETTNVTARLMRISIDTRNDYLTAKLSEQPVHRDSVVHGASDDRRERRLRYISNIINKTPRDIDIAHAILDKNGTYWLDSRPSTLAAGKSTSHRTYHGHHAIITDHATGQWIAAVPIVDPTGQWIVLDNPI